MSETNTFLPGNFSRWLKNHNGLALYNLDELSIKQAKQFYSLIDRSKDSLLPWTIFLLIDSTLHRRSTRHTDNAKRFNHGKGFVIGHQWTNVVLVINGSLIPLTPIPFYTKKYCRKNKITYRTENDAVVKYVRNLNLENYVGPHRGIVFQGSSQGKMGNGSGMLRERREPALSNC